jgi:hypothetical protein
LLYRIDSSVTPEAASLLRFEQSVSSYPASAIDESLDWQVLALK